MLRNVLGFVAGLLVGWVVNIALINFGPMIIPPPAGADFSSMDALASTIHLFEPKHFVFPFLAHALGSLVGVMVGTVVATSHKMRIALGLGVVFLLGGIAAAYMIPAPLWFEALDLIVAYIPMALLGAKLGGAGKEV